MRKGKIGWQLSLGLVALCLWAGLAKEHTFETSKTHSGVKVAAMDENAPRKFETATFALG